MAEGFLKRSSKVIDSSRLTAIPSKVKSGKIYIGSAGKEESGSMTDRGQVNYQMPINGKYSGAAGYYSGGQISQNIPVSYGMSLSPKSVQVTAGVINKYMQGNVVITPVTNLVPENIKKGAVVGGVTGTWEGYVSTNQYEPYRYGAFPEGQSYTSMMYYQGTTASYEYEQGVPGVTDTTFKLQNWNPDTYGSRKIYETTGVVFNLPIDMTPVKSIEVECTFARGNPELFIGISSQYFTDYMRYTTNFPRFDDYIEIEEYQYKDEGVKSLSVVNVEGSKYLYIGNAQVTRGQSNNIHSLTIQRVVCNLL